MHPSPALGSWRRRIPSGRRRAPDVSLLRPLHLLPRQLNVCLMCFQHDKGTTLELRLKERYWVLYKAHTHTHIIIGPHVCGL